MDFLPLALASDLLTIIGLGPIPDLTPTSTPTPTAPDLTSTSTETADADAPVRLPTWVEWVRALGPSGAFFVGLFAAGIAWKSHTRQVEADRQQGEAYRKQGEAYRQQGEAYRKQEEANHRAEFWRRVEWAVKQCSEGDLLEANMGMAVLTALAASPEITSGDLGLLQTLNNLVVDRVDSRDFDDPDDDFAPQGGAGTPLLARMGGQLKGRWPSWLQQSRR